jgi:hypothetical protein
VNDIHDRLAAIEKQNRVLRIAVTALGCVMLTVVAAAAASKPVEIWDTIRARQIELVDENGNPLAVIEEAGGKGRITTLSSEGKKLVELGTDPSGIGNLAVYGEKGTAIVSAGHDATRGNGVFARNGGEKICAGLVASPQGYGTIVVCNHDEKMVGWLVGNEKGGSLFLNDAEGGPLVIATAAAETGQGTMVLKSHEGKVLGRLPQ